MSTPVAQSELDAAFPAFHRHRKVAGAHLITNLAGQFVFLDDEEYAAFQRGALEPESELYQKLAGMNFIRSEVDVDDLSSRMRDRKRFLAHGPNLHIMVVTLRCNETCAYCHASRADMSATEKDMSKETAEKVVDLIFETTSPGITIEFQGGEPLVNYEVVKHVVEYALKKNEEAKKSLEFTMVSNLAEMDQEKLDFLVKHKVQVCTSVDGPAEIHNKQRILPGGDSHAAALQWIGKLNAAYEEIGLDGEVYHVEALPTVTRAALQNPEALIDQFVDIGCKAIFLRPLDPFGFAAQTKAKLGYSPQEFLEFYARSVDYIIGLNLKGTKILERFAGIFLTKILGETDPNFLDIRSPCGAGIGQMAYNYDGGLFVCDEGRMLHESGDDLFKIGEAGKDRYPELMKHQTVRALTAASNLDTAPDCSSCAYNPYCGICPVHSYATQGTIHGKMRLSSWCAAHMGIQDYLFGKIRENDPEVMEVFKRWTSVRNRDHYLHTATDHA
ncbi:MAG: His-Xaa-Ser system radical SAM maturase HxsB [Deltaproteobacteria bacterium]|nr:His-Xaa-Ser system radical SAM maturase HxsB [Deltaproteobacteria bacterium]